MKRHTTFGALLAALALLLAFGLATPAAHADEMKIDLHAATAEVGTDCPVGGAAYWHFVLSPNDGDLAFTSIHLAFTDGSSATFSGGGIIPNAGQLDNVFVAVPAGQTLTTLQTAGSYAMYTGSQEANLFNLSHICEGTVPPTTTTTTTTTTTIVEDTTTTTTTTTTLPESPTTTTTTTTTLPPPTTAAVLPPVVTTLPPTVPPTTGEAQGPVPTTTVVTGLPSTGTTTGTAAIAASLALGAGAVMLLLARRGQRI